MLCKHHSNTASTETIPLIVLTQFEPADCGVPRVLKRISGLSPVNRRLETRLRRWLTFKYVNASGSLSAHIDKTVVAGDVDTRGHLEIFVPIDFKVPIKG